jgi:HTH-type transcriptional regulator/antitoxin HigA
MIRNEKEYRSTRAALGGYEDALADFDVLKVIKDGVDPMIARAQLASYKRQASELRDKLHAYEALRDGKTREMEVSEVAELGRGLIEARVARGLTQRELANLAGLQEQQIQRYEKELYASANLRRLAHVASTIGIQFEAKLTLANDDAVAEDGLPAGLRLADFPFAEMNLRGWFGEPNELRRAPPNQKAHAVREFFAQAPREMHLALHRKTSGSTSYARIAALLAWQARILIKARQLTGLARRFTTPPPELVSRIAKLSAEHDGIRKAVDLLLQYGIIVVFERHLPKTKLDGAAMSLDHGTFAVIGMTARHDRVDNFWFVLLHELGHIIRHWSRVVENGIIDEETGEHSDELIEREADEFAENAILPKTTWLASTVRFTKLPTSVCEFACRHGLHPALIAGRIRRERSYTEFHEMLGAGEVRDFLLSAGMME